MLTTAAALGKGSGGAGGSHVTPEFVEAGGLANVTPALGYRESLSAERITFAR